MNYQEKLVLIKSSTERIIGGLSWTELQEELNTTEGLYQKDINDISRKVINEVEGIHGKRIYNELMIDPASVADGGLDSSVVSKIRER
ncbi:MAG: hypothetical protein AAGF89_08055, partial [Bacteroidota bacterium]